MGLDTTKIAETQRYNADMNEDFNVLIRRVNQLVKAVSGGVQTGQTTQAPTVATGAVVSQVQQQPVLSLLNTSSNVFVPGELVGFPDGKPAKAIASGSGFIRANYLCLNTCPPRLSLSLMGSGVEWVCVESGASPQPGEPAMLSTTQAGRVTNALATGGAYRQIIGQFYSAKNEGGKALVILNISLQAVRSA
jgi:hypothetical protein